MQEVARYGNDTVDIRLREGIYPLERTVDLRGLKNLTIAPYGRESVSVTGGVSVNPRQIQKVTDPKVRQRLQDSVRNRVCQIDARAAGIPLTGLSAKGFGRPALPAWSELFVDGKPLSVARWPNDSMALIGKVHCTGDIPREMKSGIGDPVFEYTETRPAAWASTEGAWIGGYFAWGYADDMVPLKHLDKEKSTITAGLPTLYGFMSGTSFRRWYALNLLEELDRPGEYVIDQPNGKIYFLPPQAQVGGDVYISVLEGPLFAIEQCHNVAVRGLTFEYSRGMGVYIEESEQVRVDSCTIRNLGYVGVSIGRGDIGSSNNSGSKTTTPEGAPRLVGTLGERLYDDRLLDRRAGHHNGVSNCHIYQVGSGGVSVGGGQRATLTPAHNYVENCRIHDFNRIERSYRAGVAVDGVGNRISHCEIFDAPSMAVLIYGNDHVVEYCDIHHVCQEIDDQGALYYGRDPSERGLKVRYCYFHDLTSAHRISATYHDDGACGMEVFGCIYYKAGTMPVLIGGGHDNVYRNNIFMDLPLAFHIDNRLQNWAHAMADSGGIFDQRLREVHYDQPPYSTAYPLLAKYWAGDPRFPRGNVVEGNLFFRVKKILNGSLAYAEWCDNWITSEDPGFVDANHPLKGFRPDAPVYRKINGFTPIPFGRIGCSLPRHKE